MYKLTSNSSVIKEGSLIIPFDERNTDYQAYLTWLSEGNTPEPADVPPKPTVDQERERARANLNPMRDTFLNRLAGIAVFTPDEAVKAECAELRTALLDITKDPAFLVAETYEAMEVALITRYRMIAVGASEAVRNVFRELEE